MIKYEELIRLKSLEVHKMIFEAFNIDSEIIKYCKNYFELINGMKMIIEFAYVTPNERSVEFLVDKMGISKEYAKYLLDKGYSNEKQSLRNKSLMQLREKLCEASRISFNNTLIDEAVLALQNKNIGDVEVKLESDVWDESISFKTLEKLNMGSIKFPYDYFCIDTSKYNWTFEGDVVTKIHMGLIKFNETPEDSRIIITLELKDDNQSNVVSMKLNMSIEENIEKNKKTFLVNSKEVAFILGRVLSVSMYLEEFKKDNRRVKTSIKKIKKNKKKGIREDNSIRIINLIQPKIEKEGYIYEKEEEEEKRTIDKAFIVRGHWREQPYRSEEGEKIIKRIWIDSFAKGQGKEKLKRVVRI